MQLQRYAKILLKMYKLRLLLVVQTRSLCTVCQNVMRVYCDRMAEFRIMQFFTTNVTFACQV